MRWTLPLLMLTASGWLHAEIAISPPSVVLDRPEGAQQVLVTSRAAEGRTTDQTRAVRYEVGDTRIATVDPLGLVRPRGEGKTEIVVRAGTETVRVPVRVHGFDRPRPVSFEHQVIPVLTKSRCNSGGCHGKAEGQNGFKLSVFGFDPAADHTALVKESRGRRLLATSPEHSLFLLKAAAQVPHGGGKKIEAGSPSYDLLRRWVREGATFGGGAEVASIRVEPMLQTLHPGEAQQLRVTATDADGREYCVTADSEYDSNAGAIAAVDGRGLIQSTNVPGEAAILVRYMGQVATCRITVPRAGRHYPRPPEHNFIDRFVWDKLDRLGIAPGDLADDATFLRRAYLDTIGTLPSVAEARAFLADTTADKRRNLVDRLVERDEYADYWAQRWADLLRVDREKMTPQGAVGVTRWLRRQFAENRPYDQMVRDILTARGDVKAEKPAAVYLAFDTPEESARSISQLFMGVRIQCAQCHHHPFEKWSQDDYFGLAGFWTGIKRKPLPNGNEAVVTLASEDLKHPRTGKSVPTRPLGGPALKPGETGDRRPMLADWLTAADNPFFARALANRLWAHYFGGGLVEPIDDMRATNPASNEPLLQALSDHLVAVKYDLKAFTRTLLASRTYQLSSRASAGNADDEQNFSHAAYRPLPAEVLLDAINQSAGTVEKFSGWPEGYRAIEIWDNRLPSYFLRVFGRPVRATVCACERGSDPSISQALHLMNSPEILAKLRAPDGRVRRLADANLAPAAVIEDLYLATLSRPPTTEEAKLLGEAFTRADRRAATEDVLWVLLNTKEFLYNH